MEDLELNLEQLQADNQNYREDVDTGNKIGTDGERESTSECGNLLFGGYFGTVPELFFYTISCLRYL